MKNRGLQDCLESLRLGTESNTVGALALLLIQGESCYESF